jgi:membrane-associated protein
MGFFSGLSEWAANYGYIAVLLIVAGDGVFPLLPGETAIIAAAVIAAEGKLNILGVIAAGALGAMIGDSTAYFIGRTGGERIRRLMVRVTSEERIRSAEGMIKRQGPALVFAGRFLPGLRIAINMSCGAGHMAYARFLTFDTLGAIAWSAQAAIIGYLGGKAFEDKPWVGLLIALVVAGLIGLFIASRERQHIKQEKAAIAAE